MHTFFSRSHSNTIGKIPQHYWAILWGNNPIAYEQTRLQAYKTAAGMQLPSMGVGWSFICFKIMSSKDIVGSQDSSGTM